jgi:hypothetical protein
MDSGEEQGDHRDPERELEGYRAAPTAALDQLEWCIDYLYRARKPDIATAIARNRKQILERLRSGPAALHAESALSRLSSLWLPGAEPASRVRLERQRQRSSGPRARRGAERGIARAIESAVM